MKYTYKLLLVCLLCFCTESLLAGTDYTWTGKGADSKWSTAANWAPEGVPGTDPTDKVTIDGSTVKNPVLDANRTIGGMTFSFRALNLNNYLLVINGTSVFNSGTILGGSLSLAGNSYINIGVVMAVQQVLATCPSVAAVDNRNFVRTQEILVPCTTESAAMLLNVPDSRETTTYYDGFNRVLQTVSKQASSGKKDLVQLHAYEFRTAKELRSYLPYEADDCSGQYKDMDNTNYNAFMAQRDYYTINPDPRIPQTLASTTYEPATFGQVVSELSPAARVLEQASVGDAWRLKTDGTAKTQKYAYSMNGATEVVRWVLDPVSYNASAYKPAPAANGQLAYYSANTLFKTISTDAEGNQQIDFKDEDGKLLLHKQKSGVTTWNNTYYIYDDFGRLIYVVPPLAAGLEYEIDASRTFTDATYFGYKLLYTYKYDARGRVKEKKLPGIASVKTVYDQLDRVVLSQDGNMAASNKWTFTKYDVVGRTVQTGLYTDSRAENTIRTDVAGQTVLFESRMTGGTGEGYTSNAFPQTIVNAAILTVNYYDDYDFNNDNSADYSYVNQGFGALEPQQFNRITGKATGSKVRNLTQGNWLISVNFYDKFGRSIQSQKNNHLYLAAGGSASTLADISTSILDFGGLLLKSKEVHVPGGVQPTVTINKRYEYDHMGRLLKTYQQNNSDTEILLSHQNYNGLGQSVETNLHSENNGASFLQSIDYRYNIRGWISSINNSKLSNDFVSGGAYSNDDSGDLFGTELLYEKAEWNGKSGGASANMNQPLYNGLISAIKWKTKNDNGSTSQLERLYQFQYYSTGALKEVQYAEKASDGTWNSLQNNYSEKNLSYDVNGNLKTLDRYRNNATTPIDQLSYTYDGNRLIKVNDIGDLTAGFKSNSTVQNASYTNPHYTYDVNGNLLTDVNKGITINTYNFLNLPEQITLANGTIVKYTYDALGLLLKKQTISGSGTITNDYAGIFLYKDGQLQSFTTTVGRAQKNGNTFNYIYDLKDHLGNIRVSFDKNPGTSTARVIQEDHYYAYGLKHEGNYVLGAANNYLYTGKELQDETGLYDFGARMYDPVLARWNSMDPMAQERMWLSPYNFVQNNPINRIDPTGAIDYGWTQTGAGAMVYDSRVYNQGDAAALYGSNAIYRPIGYSYTASTGANIVLGDYGFFFKNGELFLSPDLAEKSLAYLDPTESIRKAREAIEKVKGLNTASLGITGFITTDATIPDPSDAAWPKWAGYAIVGGVTAYLVQKMDLEIEGILRRAGGPQGVQYALKATMSGNYPCYTCPSGGMFLNKDDVWKYGETINPDSRYPDSFTNGYNVWQDNQFWGNQVEIKIKEKYEIYGYFLQYGHLPPGNKIFR